MTFSLISLAILSVAALVIVIEIVRAINRGRQKTLVTLASLFLATFVSIIVTRFLSNLLAKNMLSIIKKNFDLSEASDKLPSIEDILFAYADSFVAPLMFLAVFILVRIIIAIVIKIVYNVKEKNETDERYESEDASAHNKRPNLINGLLGALCGFIVMVVCISPIMGSVKIANKTFQSVNDEENKLFSIKIKKNIVDYVDRSSKDIVGNVFYYSGGSLVYRAVGTSKLNDNHFELKSEVDNTFATAADLLSMSDILYNISTASDEDKDMLRNLGKEVDKCETLKTATADVLPVIAKKWLNDEDYDGMKKPKVSKACESFFDKMLYVCKSSTPETVGEDLSTLLNVYLIAYENDVLISENYKEMVERAKATGAFDLIKKELNKNRRMAGISVDIDTMGVKSIASALQSFNFENYENLMGNITSVLNDAMDRNGQDRLDYVTDLTKQYIQQYGIDVGDDVIGEVAQRLVDELVDHRSSVTVDDLKEFWDKYSVKKSSSGNNTNTDTNDNTNVTLPSVEDVPIIDETDIDIPIDDGVMDEIEDAFNNGDIFGDDYFGDEYFGDEYFGDENNGEMTDEPYFETESDRGFYY